MDQATFTEYVEHFNARRYDEMCAYYRDGDRLACELYTEFACFEDLPGFSLKPLVAGEVFRCTNFVHYDLVADRFRRIRVGRYRVHNQEERGA